MKPTAHLLHGFIGCGKTTFARKLEQEYSAVRFTYDEWMARLYGQNPAEDMFPDYYARIEGLVWQQAGGVLRAGCDVVIDAGFWTRESREAVRNLVAAAGGIPKFYSVACPGHVMRARVIERSQNPPPDSLWIDEAAFDKLRAGFEPMADDEDHVWVDGDP